MFGLGKKDKDGRQSRIKHRGKYLRISRTGGIALRAEQKLGPVNVTVNTSRGVRTSVRLTKGMSFALQNGRTQLIGRWRDGPFAFNLSKTGFSASIKNQAGSFNFVKPQYSSFKVLGGHVRGKKAAQMQLIYMAFTASLFLVVIGVGIALWLCWFALITVLFLFDLLYGFVRGLVTHQDATETS